MLGSCIVFFLFSYGDIVSIRELSDSGNVNLIIFASSNWQVGKDILKQVVAMVIKLKFLLWYNSLLNAHFTPINVAHYKFGALSSLLSSFLKYCYLLHKKSEYIDRICFKFLRFVSRIA